MSIMEDRKSEYYETHDEWGRQTTNEAYKNTDCHEYCDLAQRCYVDGQKGTNPDSCVQHEFILHLMY